MRFVFSLLAAILTVFSVQVAAHAHYVWATIANGQARFALLENVGEAPSAQFEKYVADLSPFCNGKRLTLGVPKDGARYAALSTGQDVVVAESVVGVKERNGETYLLVYHAKGAASLAAAGKLTKATAELSAHREGDNLVVSVRQDGWPVPRSEVWIRWPGDMTSRSVQTDAKGEAQIPWPLQSGEYTGEFVGIRAMVKETKAGEADGKKYDSIHRWATLTFPLTTGDTTPERPFTQILRSSYGVCHEVVSNHVYYGGTTNGGRMIGEKSDGYSEYLAEVDKITDTTALQEMIRGGQAAYRYIIAFSNDDLFKTGRVEQARK